MTALERWAPWWALLVVPSAFLAFEAIAYALAPLACRTERHALVHIGPAAAMAVTLVGLVLSGWCAVRLRADPRHDAAPERRFLVMVSFAVAVLFLLATLAQWYVAGALSPCLQ